MKALFQDAIEAELVRERAREIVAGLAPRSDSPGWLERLLDRLSLGRSLGSWAAGHGGLLEYLLYALAAAVVIGLVVLLVRQVDWRRAHRAGRIDAGDGPDVRERVESLLARARAARSSGDRLLALRLFFAAFVVGLSRRGDLEFRDAWTNHELAQRGAHTDELRATLMPLVSELDGLVYGGRAISDAHLNRIEGLAEGIGT